MAGQNIPGFAVLEMNGYPAERQSLLRRTGLASLAIAPFGAIPVNMSAITAAMIPPRNGEITPQSSHGMMEWFRR